MSSDPISDRDPVVIGIATYDGPGRRESLKETIQSLEKQADWIYVYDNDHQYELPLSGKMVVVRQGDKNYGDAGKFFYACSMSTPGKDYYFLTCDDDIIYPPDYVETIIAGIEKYERQAVVSFHGKRFTGPVNSYYRRGHEDRKHYPCQMKVRRDEKVTVIGTGCMGWHSSLLELSMDDFPEKNMADILFSRICNELSIPRIVLAHEAKWIVHTEKIDLGDTLHSKFYKDDPVQTKLFNSVEWVV